MKNSRFIEKPMFLLLTCYGSFVLIRFLLALFTSAYPMINIDEFLYYGIARSLAAGEGLMFRGQPADFSYILYSLVIVPIYWTGLQNQLLFRALQLWNILLCSLSIFPLYFLACRLTQSKKKALSLACLSMLLPDFMLGQLMMAENVIMPLFYTLMAVAARYMGVGNEKYSERWIDILWVGILGGLLFTAKPGAIIPSIVLLGYWCISGILSQRKARALRPIAALGVMLTVVTCFFLLLSVLGGKPSILSIYENQVNDALHLDVFFTFLGVYPVYFALAGGVGILLLIAVNRKHFSQPQAALLLCIILSLSAAIIGVAWAINRYEYNTNTAHLRYIGMYLPLFLLFANTPLSHSKEKIKETKTPVYLLYFAILALLIIPGVYKGVNKSTVFAGNMTLASVIFSFRNNIPTFVYMLLAIVLCTGSLWLVLQQKRKNVQRAVTILYCVCLLINGTCAYSISAQDTKLNNPSEARQLWEEIDNASPLYIYTDITKASYYSAFDVYSSNDISYVSLNDMFNQLYTQRGVYRPYLPEGQRGNIASRLTPDTNVLVLDATAYCMVQLSDNVEHWTTNENSLHLVKIKNPEKPWLDSVIGNTVNTYLEARDTGILLVFNQEYLRSPMTICMKLYCEDTTSLQIYSNHEYKTIQLEAGTHLYEVTFDKPADAYNMIADQTIRFYGYELKNP